MASDPVLLELIMQRNVVENRMRARASVFCADDAMDKARFDRLTEAIEARRKDPETTPVVAWDVWQLPDVLI